MKILVKRFFRRKNTIISPTKYSVIPKICSVSAKNMMDRLNFED